MELYESVSYAISQRITRDYSSSFSGSAKLFPEQIRRHIYAIYGLVRIADEVVDTYRGDDTEVVLRDLEKEVYAALKRGYSANPVVHSFALTAREYNISRKLIQPFFESMFMDLQPAEYTKKRYEDYIYGSAEVVGLMCLRVFVEGDDKAYNELHKGASALGSAYQKVNFLRDLAADYKELGRIYFPGTTFEKFNDATKNLVIKDIEKDFIIAKQAITQLPKNSRKAVAMSYTYYTALLIKLKNTPAEVIKNKRVRINAGGKAMLMAKTVLKGEI